MVIYILNCLAFLFCTVASSSRNYIDQGLKLVFLCLAVYNGFEAYRFYILGA